VSSADDQWAKYFVPGTRTLANNLGIRDGDTLKTAERIITTNRAIALERAPIKGNYDVAHLKSIHTALFKDVYPWAGQFRDVDLAKGRTEFAPAFPPVYRTLENYTGRLLETVARDNFHRGVGKEAFVGKLSSTYNELNYAHPFREGNGRTTRIFLGQLAKDAGYHLDWSRVDASRWADVSEAGVARNDVSGIRDVMRQVTTPERARAFANAVMNGDYGRAIEKHPELAGAVRLLSQVERSIREEYRGFDQAKGADVMLRAALKIHQDLHDGGVPRAQDAAKVHALVHGPDRAVSR
jgi:cell filamentation protein